MKLIQEDNLENNWIRKRLTNFGCLDDYRLTDYAATLWIIRLNNHLIFGVFIEILDYSFRMKWWWWFNRNGFVHKRLVWIDDSISNVVSVNLAKQIPIIRTLRLKRRELKWLKRTNEVQRFYVLQWLDSMMSGMLFEDDGRWSSDDDLWAMIIEWWSLTMMTKQWNTDDVLNEPYQDRLWPAGRILLTDSTTKWIVVM